MWTWLIAVVAFFSLPESKPATYVVPAFVPLAWLVADAIAATGRRARWLGTATLVPGALLSAGYVVVSGLTYEGDNRALARALGALRGPDDATVFVRTYGYDIPMYARLRDPVRVAYDWRDPRLAADDDWRRELAEAGRFAPQQAAALLQDESAGLRPLCDRTKWVVAPAAAAPFPPGSSATRVFESHGRALWRVPRASCGPGSVR
jgi:hypothetical protein